MLTLLRVPRSNLHASGTVDAASRATEKRGISNWAQKLSVLLLLLEIMLVI